MLLFTDMKMALTTLAVDILADADSRISCQILSAENPPENMRIFKCKWDLSQDLLQLAKATCPK